MAVNSVTLVGNLGGDPEIKVLDGGAKVASFSLATTDKGYKKQDGTEIPERTEWHSIVAWDRFASLAEYAKKGDKVTILGRLKTDKWETDGVSHSKTSIVVESLELPQKIGQ